NPVRPTFQGGGQSLNCLCGNDYALIGVAGGVENPGDGPRRQGQGNRVVGFLRQVHSPVGCDRRQLIFANLFEPQAGQVVHVGEDTGGFFAPIGGGPVGTSRVGD